MHQPADSMTKLCHSGKHNNAVGESIPMHYSSEEKAELKVVGRGRSLSVCQGVDEFGLPAIRYKVFSNWDRQQDHNVILNIMTKWVSMRL